MQKNNYPADESSLLYRETFDPNFLSRLAPSEFKIEEFGISARIELSEDILLKEIACDCEGQIKTMVFLCYNWKRQVPFVLVKRVEHHAKRTYTPQYGHEDNYPESTWTDTMLQFYSSAQLSIRQPKIAAILHSL